MVAGKIQIKWSLDLAATLAAAPFVVIFLPFLPSVVMPDDMKSPAILAGIETLLLSVILPAINSLFVTRAGRECAQAYKDVDAVVQTASGAGITSKVARLRLVAVIKG